MSHIPADYFERLYAGWLAKIIGIRLGAPIEGWTYEQIRRTYCELTNYPVLYDEFAADDDSNGPLFFLRALLEVKPGEKLKAQDVAEALLNYAPFEHGFFWWGGYGVSTEHTAYLNLRAGIPAPRSGSIEQNGATIAEQIGGQIFIDTWGLVAPGNMELAVEMAQQAASVTHGGNGVYGGMFVAAAISYAFIEHDIRKIIEKALTYIPEDCEYARVVRCVMSYHDAHPNSWRDCFNYIHANFGYDRYPGNCHIIPNIAVMILALCYGNGDFTDTINICNMCGWDTDCNVGNVASIMGVAVGLEGIDYDKWIKPIHDLLICSSVIGSLNIMDIPYSASFIAMLAYRLAGEQIPEPFNGIIRERIHSAHFEYPGSTHAMRVSTDDTPYRRTLEYNLANTDEAAFTGRRSLKMTVMSVSTTQRIFLNQRTYYVPSDFHDSRYDPCFSPLLYPGQDVRCAVMIPDFSGSSFVRLYAKDLRSDALILGERIWLTNDGHWENLTMKIPAMEGALIREAGVLFEIGGEQKMQHVFTAYIDDLIFDGKPDYTLDFARENTEVWTGLHREISQMTKLKGIMELDNGALSLACSDFAEGYTGHYDWGDYEAAFDVMPITGEKHTVNFRVQGALRSYAFGFDGKGRLALLKNAHGYHELASCACDWELGKSYHWTIRVLGNKLTAQCGDSTLTFEDDEAYLNGSVGISVRDGSHIRVSKIAVRGL